MAGEAEDMFTGPRQRRDQYHQFLQLTYNSTDIAISEAESVPVIAMSDVTCLSATPGSGPHFDPPAYILSNAGYGPEYPVKRPSMKQSWLSSLRS